MKRVDTTLGVAHFMPERIAFALLSTPAATSVQQQRRTHDMMKLRAGSVSDRLANFLRLLARNEDGTQRELDRRDLPLLKDIGAILDAATETVCLALNAFLPARVYQRPATHAWVGEQMAIAA